MCTYDTYIYLDDPSGSWVIISKPFLQSQHQAERMLTMLEAGRAGPSVKVTLFVQSKQSFREKKPWGWKKAFPGLKQNLFPYLLSFCFFSHCLFFPFFFGGFKPENNSFILLGEEFLEMTGIWFGKPFWNHPFYIHNDLTLPKMKSGKFNISSLLADWLL